MKAQHNIEWLYPLSNQIYCHCIIDLMVWPLIRSDWRNILTVSHLHVWLLGRKFFLHLSVVCMWLSQFRKIFFPKTKLNKTLQIMALIECPLISSWSQQILLWSNNITTVWAKIRAYTTVFYWHDEMTHNSWACPIGVIKLCLEHNNNKVKNEDA